MSTHLRSQWRRVAECRREVTARHQQSVAIAESRLIDEGRAGDNFGSLSRLVAYVARHLPGWDVEEINERGRQVGSPPMEEVLEQWGRPGLILQEHPGLGGGGGADAYAQVGDIALPSVDTSDLLILHYSSLGEMNELIALHEVAHVLDPSRFTDGHGDAWARTYVNLVERAGLSEAANLLRMMTGQV